MVKKLGPGDKPFSTTNVLLAFCLYVAGVPFRDNRWPCTNEYTKDKLRECGFSGPTDLIEAVKKAIKDGKRGKVVWRFKKTPNLKNLLTAYNDQEVQIDAPGNNIFIADFQRELMRRVAASEIDVPEALVRSTCVTLKLRGKFVNLWRELPGILILENEGESEYFDTIVTDHSGIAHDAKGVRSPGWKMVSTNAKPETLMRLGFIE